MSMWIVDSSPLLLQPCNIMLLDVSTSKFQQKTNRYFNWVICNKTQGHVLKLYPWEGALQKHHMKSNGAIHKKRHKQSKQKCLHRP